MVEKKTQNRKQSRNQNGKRARGVVETDLFGDNKGEQNK